MSNILGVHWIPIHGRPSDLDYMQRLQPGSVKIVDPDVTQISRAHQAAPDALIVLRDHPLSEQHDDMRRDPEGTGVRHARRWKEKRDEYYNQATQRNLPMPPLDNTVVLGINEPRVWDALAQTVRYTVAFLRECSALGLRAGALNLSVGWPANTGPDTPADWQPYALLEPEIRSGNHYLFLHEYFDERGPEHNWRWWCGRFKWCPWQVPIIIGESGLDKYVSDPGVDRNRRGWQGWLSADDYARHLHRYATLCAQDGRIHSIQPFTTDGANDWHSFDTESAHNAILAQQWPRTSPQKPSVLVPGVGTAPQPQILPMPPTTPVQPATAYVNAIAGLQLRKGPGTEHGVWKTLAHGTPVEIIGRQGDWLQTRTGWLYSAYVSMTKPPVDPHIVPPPVQPVQPVTPTQPGPSGIIDPLAGQAIIAIESGGQAFGPGNRLLLRFETHLFNRHTNNAHTNLFRHGSPPWTGQEWRQSENAAWQQVHTGNQNSEWAAFEWASTLNRQAALLSISMGLGQILGSHYRRLGYASAESMFRAFGDQRYGTAAQMLGFLNFFLSDPVLFKAMREKDFHTIAVRYNGAGAAARYAGLMKAEYDRLRGAS